MSFDGASVLVTGGSRGIGREIALRFADEGAARVAIGYMRNDTAAEEVAAELRLRGAEAVLVRGNVSSTRVADEVAALARLDVLVHSAATGVARPALETEALEHFPNREQMLAWSLKRTPAGRLVEPRDVAAAITFLCSPEAEMVRGQTLVVDGGFSVVV